MIGTKKIKDVCNEIVTYIHMYYYYYHCYYHYYYDRKKKITDVCNGIVTNTYVHTYITNTLNVWPFFPRKNI